jgi:hypothetical protein
MMFTLLYGLFIFIGLYAATWIPVKLLRIDFVQEYEAEKIGPSSSLVKIHIDELFLNNNLQIPNGLKMTVEVIEPDNIAQLLLDDLNSNNIEAYISKGDEHTELRIYDVSELRYRVRFVKKSKQFRIAAQNDSDLVKIAIVFSDIGQSSITNITSIKEPVTLAIKPYSPFAMRIAQQAALQWHEVIMDVREIEEPNWNVIPYYSGILTNQQVYPPSKYITQLFPSAYYPTDAGRNIKSGIIGFGISARSTLQQGITTALQSGQAIIIVSSQDPEISTVLNWIKTNDNSTIQMVLLSEIN